MLRALPTIVYNYPLFFASFLGIFESPVDVRVVFHAKTRFATKVFCRYTEVHKNRHYF